MVSLGALWASFSQCSGLGGDPGHTHTFCLCSREVSPQSVSSRDAIALVDRVTTVWWQWMWALGKIRRRGRCWWKPAVARQDSPRRPLEELEVKRPSPAGGLELEAGLSWARGVAARWLLHGVISIPCALVS